MIYLFDNGLNTIYSINPKEITELTQDDELKGLITANATVVYKKDYEDASYFGYKSKNKFNIFKIRKVTKEDGAISFDGIHLFFDDLVGRVVRDIRNQNTTPALVVEKIIAGTGWHVAANNATNTASENYYYVSALEAFNRAVETWNFEYSFDISFKDGKIYDKKIYIYDKLSKDYGKWYEYGDKLISVVAETSTDDLCTAYIGRGKGLPKKDEEEQETVGFERKLDFKDIKYKDKPIGQDYIEIKKATELFGYPDGTPKIGVVEFSDIEDAAELAKATYEYALENARPKVELRATALEDQSVELGETVTIKRKDMDIAYKTRVFKIHKDILADKVTSFEFGDKVTVSQGQRLKAQAYEQRKRQKEVNAYIDNIRDEITASYFNDGAYNYDLKIGNEYGLPAGYYSFDKPIDKEPTKVVYMGAGKMLIANSKKPDGSWDWRTALTADGVVADEVVGTLGKYAKINAAQINVNNNFFDSDLGKQFKILDGKIVDETGKVRDDLKLIDGKITTLDGKVVKQDVMYNNVKITQSKGLQVLDNQQRERVQLGNWASGRYGLKLSDKSGNITVLDDEGILQSWQDSQTDNVDRGYPLELHIYIPKETKRIYKASLNIYIDSFRAYQRGNEYSKREYSTSDSGGGDYTSTDSGGGDYLTIHGAEHVKGSNLTLAVFGNNSTSTIGRTESFWHTTDHEHSLNINDHRHRVDIPDHTHRFEIPEHSHEPIFGIITQRGSSSYTILVNGRDITSSLTGSYSFSRAQSDLNIANYLSIGSWNTISIGNNDLGRVSASIFIQALLGYGGY